MQRFFCFKFNRFYLLYARVFTNLFQTCKTCQWLHKRTKFKRILICILFATCVESSCSSSGKRNTMKSRGSVLAMAEYSNPIMYIYIFYFLCVYRIRQIYLSISKLPKSIWNQFYNRIIKFNYIDPNTSNWMQLIFYIITAFNINSRKLSIFSYTFHSLLKHLTKIWKIPMQILQTF